MLLTYGAYGRLHTLNQMNLRGRVIKKPGVKKNFVSYVLRRPNEDMNCQNYSLNFRQGQLPVALDVLFCKDLMVIDRTRSG